jgi:hypothetical protein
VDSKADERSGNAQTSSRFRNIPENTMSRLEILMLFWEEIFRENVIPRSSRGLKKRLKKVKPGSHHKKPACLDDENTEAVLSCDIGDGDGTSEEDQALLDEGI